MYFIFVVLCAAERLECPDPVSAVNFYEEKNKTWESTSYLKVVRVNTVKNVSHGCSLMSCRLLIARLYFVVTLKDPAGYLALLFISARAIEPPVWSSLSAPSGPCNIIMKHKPQTQMSLFSSAKDSPLNLDTVSSSSSFSHFQLKNTFSGCAWPTEGQQLYNRGKKMNILNTTSWFLWVSLAIHGQCLTSSEFQPSIRNILLSNYIPLKPWTNWSLLSVDMGSKESPSIKWTMQQVWRKRYHVHNTPMCKQLLKR